MAWTALAPLTGRPRLTSQLLNTVIDDINYLADRPLILNKLTVSGSPLVYTNAGGETALPAGAGGNITPVVARSTHAGQSVLMVQFIIQMQASAALNFTLRIKRNGVTLETFFDRLDNTVSAHRSYLTFMPVAANALSTITTTIEVTTASQSITLPIGATLIYTVFEI